MPLLHWHDSVPPAPLATRNSVGDVCITPVSVNWVCKKSTWTLQAEGYPNQCFRPQEVAGPNATQLYGECVFATDNVSPCVRVPVCHVSVVARGCGAKHHAAVRPSACSPLTTYDTVRVLAFLCHA